MKKILALLMLFSIAFAQGNWVPVAGIAVMLSLMVLLVVFMIGYGFNIRELRFLAVEEMYQVIATILMIALLYSAALYFDEFSKYIGGEEGLQNTSIQMINNNLANHSIIVSELKNFAIEVGQESSKSVFCSLQGPGYTIAPCGSFRTILPSVSMSLQAISLSSAELSSLKILSMFGRNYTFTLLLPIGILLRTFRFTRGAGGLLIGFAISLYILLPLGVLFMNILTSDFEASYPQFQNIQEQGLPSANNNCDPIDAGEHNLHEAENIFTALTSGNIKLYLYYFLIKGTLTTVICLAIVILGIKEISKLAGAEVDVTALARLA